MEKKKKSRAREDCLGENVELLDQMSCGSSRTHAQMAYQIAGAFREQPLCVPTAVGSMLEVPLITSIEHCLHTEKPGGALNIRRTPGGEQNGHRGKVKRGVEARSELHGAMGDVVQRSSTQCCVVLRSFA